MLPFSVTAGLIKNSMLNEPATPGEAKRVPCSPSNTRAEPEVLAKAEPEPWRERGDATRERLLDRIVYAPDVTDGTLSSKERYRSASVGVLRESRQRPSYPSQPAVRAMLRETEKGGQEASPPRRILLSLAIAVKRHIKNTQSPIFLIFIPRIEVLIRISAE